MMFPSFASHSESFETTLLYFFFYISALFISLSKLGEKRAHTKRHNIHKSHNVGPRKHQRPQYSITIIAAKKWTCFALVLTPHATSTFSPLRSSPSLLQRRGERKRGVTNRVHEMEESAPIMPEAVKQHAQYKHACMKQTGTHASLFILLTLSPSIFDRACFNARQNRMKDNGRAQRHRPS